MGVLERAIKKHADIIKERNAKLGGGARRVRPAQPPAVGREDPAKWSHQEIRYDHIIKTGLAPEVQYSRDVEEQFIRIKGPVMLNAYGPASEGEARANVVMVTSAMPGEGKTFCSWNLAACVAKDKERPVILVDADPLKPKLSRDLEDSDKLGFLDLLENPDLTIDDVLIQTNINQLRFIPSGRPRESSSTLFFGDRAEQICDQLATRANGGLVIFDSSPLLLTNESKILANLVGQVLLVVAAGVTGQSQVQEAVELVNEERPLNVIVNKYPHEWKGDAYGYGYGYGYGHSSSTSEAAQPDA